MPRINVNLNEVQDSQFETFTEGLHAVEIQPSTKMKQSEAGAYIQIIAKCIEGDMEGKMIGWNCSLLPNALWDLKAMMVALGIEWEDDGFDLEELFEEKLVVNVTHREWPIGSGEMRNQVEGDYYTYGA